MSIKLDRKEEEIFLLKKVLDVLKKHSDEIPIIQGFNEVYGIPQHIYDLLVNNINFREMQVRIRYFCEKTGIEAKIVRGWLKEYTMREIEQSYNKETQKIMLKDLVKL